MVSLAGKAFVLTGGGSGIGLATARVLASRGASLYVGDVNAAALEASLPSIIHTATAAASIKTSSLDVRNRTDVREFMKKAKAEFGRLHGAANIAGVTGKGMGVSKTWELDTDEYEFVMAVNARGVFNCLAEQLRPGVLPEGSSIVNMASVNSFKALDCASPYVASKHAVVGLTKTAALEAGPRDIRVNGVAPGTVETPMLRKFMEQPDCSFKISTPIARPAQAEEVGRLVAFLLSDDSTFITGATYSIDGGWTV
ncbi:hypothetical protein PV08_05145 [Exophiala spinifera]|uniref:Uncharacterized protein n=1 Tax=Exophiala spinifera TaxID=91928 RepID=A0A0D2BH52_9EURO|nr:uncharacterized protein PV08_05145 [Exophiala spinifera]KIW17950.1 hypothetical protein PV08_05145 [Exophiala spinifera]